MGIKAIAEYFAIFGSLDLFNSNSREPSKTIKIKPIVPKNGKTGERLGIEISIIWLKCLTTNPKNRSNMTEGIFVLAEVKSKT